MKNSRITYLSIALVVIVTASFVMTGCKKKSDNYIAKDTNKEERQHISKGNKLFEEKEYADAEVEYRKALQANPQSAAACYNLALALAKQINNSDSVNKQTLYHDADSIFHVATSMTSDSTLIAMANHNIGNLRYQQEKYEEAIKAYKKALRANPADDDTRYNLRMAQLKLKEQQEQQDKKDQDKQNQQQQNQDKQNQEQQNQDKQNQEQQNQDKQKEKPDNGDQPKPDNSDDRNTQQVLKAMQDKEKETQQKVKMMQQQQEQQRQRVNRHKW